jgi:ppGpp synthetase/RelA/SpoT-type nucleotidyltranferase
MSRRQPTVSVPSPVVADPTAKKYTEDEARNLAPCYATNAPRLHEYLSRCFNLVLIVAQKMSPPLALYNKSYRLKEWPSVSKKLVARANEATDPQLDALHRRSTEAARKLLDKRCDTTTELQVLQEAIPDLLGMRLVFVNMDSVLRFAAALADGSVSHLQCEKSRDNKLFIDVYRSPSDKTILPKSLVPYRSPPKNDYSAIHLQLGECDTPPALSSAIRPTFELQLRSLSEELWAEVSHSVSYKRPHGLEAEAIRNQWGTIKGLTESIETNISELFENRKTLDAQCAWFPYLQLSRSYDITFHEEIEASSLAPRISKARGMYAAGSFSDACEQYLQLIADVEQDNVLLSETSRCNVLRELKYNSTVCKLYLCGRSSLEDLAKCENLLTLLVREANCFALAHFRLAYVYELKATEQLRAKKTDSADNFLGLAIKQAALAIELVKDKDSNCSRRTSEEELIADMLAYQGTLFFRKHELFRKLQRSTATDLYQEAIARTTEAMEHLLTHRVGSYSSVLRRCENNMCYYATERGDEKVARDFASRLPSSGVDANPLILDTLACYEWKINKNVKAAETLWTRALNLLNATKFVGLPRVKGMRSRIERHRDEAGDSRRKWN